MRAEGHIRIETGDKWKHLPLLLLGDEQEELIRGYLDRGDLLVWEENGEAVAVCAVTEEGLGLYELQNIAVDPRFQRRGIGRALIEFIWHFYPDIKALQLGTGDSPSTVGFYLALGFEEAGREPDYFLTHYDHPIYEEGAQLRDRILFRKTKTP